MKDYESLHEALCDHFNIDDPYTYNLTRVKSAFAEGTMSFEDFEEWTEDDVAEIVEVVKNWVEEGSLSSWDFGIDDEGNPIVFCKSCGRKSGKATRYCPYCGKKMIGKSSWR